MLFYKLLLELRLDLCRIHIDDRDFALEDGLSPRNLVQGKIKHQFEILSEEAEIDKHFFNDISDDMVSHSEQVEKLVNSSFLDSSTKRNYWQAYQGRLKQLAKE